MQSILKGEIPMKKIISSIMIVALLGFWTPCASAEMSQELDPMVSPDPQAVAAEGTSVAGTTTEQASNVVSTADATAAEKKIEEPKKPKSKKASKKKSDEKKKKKTSSKKSKKSKKSSNS
jgi:hypothetical protein